MKGIASVFSVMILGLGLILPVLSRAEMKDTMAKDVSVKAEALKADSVVAVNDVAQNVNTSPALDGFCATCIINGNKTMGSAEFTSVYEGKTYMFSSAETKKVFDVNPALNSKLAELKYEAMKNEGANGGAMQAKDGVINLGDLLKAQAKKDGDQMKQEVAKDVEGMKDAMKKDVDMMKSEMKKEAGTMDSVLTDAKTKEEVKK